MALDRGELERLYVRLERPLYNVAYRWLWHEQDAADVVQEAFVKLWQARARVRLDSVEPYLFRIAVNLASNRRRKAKLWQVVSLAEPQAVDGPATHERRERQDAVRRAIEKLPEKLRRVVVLTELSGMSYAEVAAALDIPSGTVGSRRAAAIERLERELHAFAEVTP